MGSFLAFGTQKLSYLCLSGTVPPLKTIKSEEAEVFLTNKHLVTVRSYDHIEKRDLQPSSCLRQSHHPQDWGEGGGIGVLHNRHKFMTAASVSRVMSPPFVTLPQRPPARSQSGKPDSLNDWIHLTAMIRLKTGGKNGS